LPVTQLPGLEDPYPRISEIGRHKLRLRERKPSSPKRNHEVTVTRASPAGGPGAALARQGLRRGRPRNEPGRRQGQPSGVCHGCRSFSQQLSRSKSLGHSITDRSHAPSVPARPEWFDPTSDPRADGTACPRAPDSRVVAAEEVAGPLRGRRRWANSGPRPAVHPLGEARTVGEALSRSSEARPGQSSRHRLAGCLAMADPEGPCPTISGIERHHVRCRECKQPLPKRNHEETTTLAITGRWSWRGPGAARPFRVLRRFTARAVTGPAGRCMALL
jgi:hypothetical protein